MLILPTVRFHGGAGGGGGGSYQLRSTFSGASKDTAIFDATTRTPGFPVATIGGSDVEGSGVALITPTAGGDFMQGRSSVALNLDLSNREMALHIAALPTVRSKVLFTYSHQANRSMNFRFELEFAFNNYSLSAVWSNFGGGTPWSNSYGSSAASVPPWWFVVDEGDDLCFYVGSAQDSRTLVRRLSLTSGGDGYFPPNAGDIGCYVQNYNSEAVAPSASFSEIYMTA